MSCLNTGIPATLKSAKFMSLNNVYIRIQYYFYKLHITTLYVHYVRLYRELTIFSQAMGSTYVTSTFHFIQESDTQQHYHMHDNPILHHTENIVPFLSQCNPNNHSFDPDTDLKTPLVRVVIWVLLCGPKLSTLSSLLL